MKIAFIHNDPRYVSGTNYINRLVEEKMASRGIEVVPIFPDKDVAFSDYPRNLGGMYEVLIFFSTCRDKERAADCDAVYGTTYSAIAYVGYSKKVVSHFGSTMKGISEALAADQYDSDNWVWRELVAAGAIGSDGFDPSRDRFLEDIAQIESYVAQKAAAVIAASEKVKNELIAQGVLGEKIAVVHNAIEDFWFDGVSGDTFDDFGICSFGRFGGSVKDLMVKGVDRLAEVYDRLGDIRKTSIILSRNERMCRWFEERFKNHVSFYNLQKEEVKKVVSGLRGNALLITSRYEGFSLPLIEGMSQGLIPVSFNVGVVPEVVKNGENGFIVSSVEEMVDKINTLSKDKDLRVSMSKAAFASSQSFKADAMADKIIDVIKSL